MAFRLQFHEDALDDLKQVLEWSRNRHPGTTGQFASELFNYLGLLEQHPYLGAPVAEHRGVRRLLHSPLLIYYRVDEATECVEVLHIWHGSRQPPIL